MNWQLAKSAGICTYCRPLTQFWQHLIAGLRTFISVSVPHACIYEQCLWKTFADNAQICLGKRKDLWRSMYDDNYKPGEL